MKRLQSLCFLLILTACPKQKTPEPPEPEAAEHQDEEEHEAMPRQVTVSAEISAKTGLKTEPVKRASLSTTISLPGEIVAEPDRTARLSATTSGRLEQVTFNEGSLVKRGEVMAMLRVTDVGRLRGAFAATSAKAQAARSNAERLKVLQQNGLGAEQNLVDAEADARAQEAEAKALSEHLGAMGAGTGAEGGSLIPLRAPISGVVVARQAVVGQPITAADVLATIVDLSEVWFLGRIFEMDLGRLREGARSVVQLNAFPGLNFEGEVEHVGQQTDPVARTLTARVRLDNRSGKLRIGLFGTAHVEVLEAADSPPQLIVPRSAITDLGGRTVVFVKAADGDFVVHEVTTGDAALTQIQILSGLSEGEDVATVGVFTLKSMLLKATLKEDE